VKIEQWRNVEGPYNDRTVELHMLHVRTSDEFISWSRSRDNVTPVHVSLLVKHLF